MHIISFIFRNTNKILIIYLDKKIDSWYCTRKKKGIVKKCIFIENHLFLHLLLFAIFCVCFSEKAFELISLHESYSMKNTSANLCVVQICCHTHPTRGSRGIHILASWHVAYFTRNFKVKWPVYREFTLQYLVLVKCREGGMYHSIEPHIKNIFSKFWKFFAIAHSIRVKMTFTNPWFYIWFSTVFYLMNFAKRL